MECPRCKVDLKVQSHEGIDVDRCFNCKGMWLDHHEIDQLEDTVLAEDDVKGTMIYAQREGDVDCPKCGKQMAVFNYRAYNLPIDYCTAGHGFWLDQGEDKQIRGFMKQRIKDLNRVASAEAEWGKFMQNLGSKSLFGGIKKWFKGK